MIKLSLTSGFSGSLFGRSERRGGRDAYTLLNRYDEHMLKDVGLTRSDVETLRRGR